ncbi:MAG: hypothetical protein ACQKBW_12115, partial [Puniceicoccales bacterium]
MKKLTLLTLCLLSPCLSALAALTLQVNTDNKTMAFVGSFDGTIEDSGGGNYIIVFQNLNAGVYGNDDGYLTGVSDALKFVVSG